MLSSADAKVELNDKKEVKEKKKEREKYRWESEGLPLPAFSSSSSSLRWPLRPLHAPLRLTPRDLLFPSSYVRSSHAYPLAASIYRQDIIELSFLSSGFRLLRFSLTISRGGENSDNTWPRSGHLGMSFNSEEWRVSWGVVEKGSWIARNYDIIAS